MNHNDDPPSIYIFIHDLIYLFPINGCSRTYAVTVVWDGMGCLFFCSLVPSYSTE